MDFHYLYAGVSEDAIDLLQRMLVFSKRKVIWLRLDPSKRITVQEALESPFLASARKPEAEILSAKRMLFPFEYDSRNDEGEKFRLRRLIYQEAMQFQYHCFYEMMYSEKVDPMYNMSGGRRRSNTIDLYNYHPTTTTTQFGHEHGSYFVTRIICRFEY